MGKLPTWGKLLLGIIAAVILVGMINRIITLFQAGKKIGEIIADLPANAINAATRGFKMLFNIANPLNWIKFGVAFLKFFKTGFSEGWPTAWLDLQVEALTIVAGSRSTNPDGTFSFDL